MTIFNIGDRVRLISDNSVMGRIVSEKSNKYEIQLDIGGKIRKTADKIEKTSVESFDKYKNFAEGQFNKIDEMKVPLILRKFDYRDNTKIHSMGTANIEHYDYQYKAPLKLMKSYTDSILIADEVGLGKTISAGLCWNELALRYKLSRLLIVCPASLRQKWRDELRDKFNIISHVCDSQKELDKQLEKIQDLNGALIISHHLCRNEKMTELWEKLAQKNDKIFDALILDEAHHIKNKGSKLYKAIKDIQESIEYRIFLSATPIQNKGKDLYGVMSGLDDIYEDEHVFGEYMQQTEQTQKNIKEVQQAKSSSDIDILFFIINEKIEHIINNNPWDETTQAKILDVLEKQDVFYNHYTRTRRVNIGMLEKRNIKNIDFKLSDEEFEIIKDIQNLINKYCNAKNADIEQLNKSIEDLCINLDNLYKDYQDKNFYKYLIQQVKDLYIKYEYNAEHLKIKNLEKNKNFKKYCDEYSVSKDKLKSELEKVKLSKIRKHFVKNMPLKYLCSSIQSALKNWGDTIEESEWDDTDDNDKQDAGKMITYIAENIDLGSKKLKKDTKYERLKEILQTHIKNKKCIIFSQFKNTVAHMQDLLKQDGFSVLAVDGGVKNKHEVVAQFEQQDYDILLTTETLSEGVDLQFCDTIINYDVPWNPMRLEQRIGRIDRIGQKADEIYIYNLYGKNTIDERIYSLLNNKFEVILQYLGDFSPILEQHAKAILNADEEEVKKQKQILEEKEKEFKQQLENEKNFLASDQYMIQGIKKQHNEMLTADDLVLLLKTLCQTVYPQSSIAITEQQDNKILVSLELCPTTKLDFENFIKKYNLPKSEIKRKTCLSRVATKEERFKNYKDDYTFITLMHPFISFAQQKLSEMEGKIPVCFAGRIKTDTISKGIYIIASNTSLFEFKDEEKINYIRSTGMGYKMNTDFSNLESITELELENLEKIVQNPNTEIIPSNFTQHIDKNILSGLSDKIKNDLENIYKTMIDEEFEDIDVLSENSKKAITTAHNNKVARLQKEMDNISGEQGKKLRQAQIDKAKRLLEYNLTSIENRSPEYNQLEMLEYLALIQII